MDRRRGTISVGGGGGAAGHIVHASFHSPGLCMVSGSQLAQLHLCDHGAPGMVFVSVIYQRLE